MARKITIITALFAASMSGMAMAAPQCQVEQDGNTWNMLCSDNGSGEAQYQCEFRITVTNADGESDTIDVSGSMTGGQDGVVIWSGIEHDGSAIQSVSQDSGACSQ